MKQSMSWKLEWDIKKYQNYFLFLYISCLEMPSANPGCRVFFLWDFSMLANLQADRSYRGLKESTQLWIQRIQRREPATCAQMITFGQTSSVHYHKCTIWNLFNRNKS